MRIERRFLLWLGGLLICSSCGPEGVEEAALPAVCGDGIEHPSEGCDDGNMIPRDGCSPRCVPSGTHFECVTLLEGSWEDDVATLLPLPDGTFLAGGKLERGDDYSGWIGRFHESGEVSWFQEIAPEKPGDNGQILDIASDGQGGAWALSRRDVNQLFHLDEAGKIGAQVEIAAATDVYRVPHAIEVTPTSVWIGGSSQEDLWLGRYDVATEELTTLLFEDHLGYKDVIWAMGRSPTEIAVAATVSTSPNWDLDVGLTATTDILLIRFDLQGKEIGRALSSAEPEATHARLAERVTWDGKDGWVVGGIGHPFDVNVPYASWVARIDPPPTWEWTDYGFSDTLMDIISVAGLEGDVIVASGYIDSDPGDEIIVEGWLAGLNADGSIRWQHEHRSAEHAYYEERLLEVDHEGRVRTGARASTSQGSSRLESCLIEQ